MKGVRLQKNQVSKVFRKVRRNFLNQLPVTDTSEKLPGESKWTRKASGEMNQTNVQKKLYRYRTKMEYITPF